MDAFDGLDGAAVPDAGDSWILSTSDPPTLAYASQKYANSCLAGQTDPYGDPFRTCDEPVAMSGPRMRQWVNEWLANSNDLNHTSFMTALASTARTESQASWCDVGRLFAIHTPGNEATPQDLGLTTPIPIKQYSNACLTSPIKDWIGPPPDPSLTNLDRVLNPKPSICEVCPVGSTLGADRCICGSHQIPADLNCFQCAAGEIAVTVDDNWHCASCGEGVPIDGQNSCQCNPGATQAPDGTCVSACGPHEVWQGGRCVDCGTSASYPDPTGPMCRSCPPSTPFCWRARTERLCYGNCQASCGPCYNEPEPGSMLCGDFNYAPGCVP
jgi:hypothetical protein